MSVETPLSGNPATGFTPANDIASLARNLVGTTPSVEESTPAQGTVPEAPVYRHGDTTPDGKLIVDPNEPVDLTKFVSARKQQENFERQIADYRNRLEAIEQQTQAQKAAELAQQSEAEMKAHFIERIRAAQTEAQRAQILREFYQAKEQMLLNSIEEQKYQESLKQTITGWDRWMAESGVHPEFAKVVNRQAAQMSGNDPIRFHENRMAITQAMLVAALRGEAPNPFQPTAAPTPPAPTPTPPAAISPSGSSQGQVDYLSQFQNGDFRELKRRLNMR